MSPMSMMSLAIADIDLSIIVVADDGGVGVIVDVHATR